MPSTLALLRSVFPDAQERRLAIAVWAAAFSGGAALGPIVGGFLLEHFWWGSVFLVNTLTMMGGRDADLRAAAREATEQYRSDVLDLLHRVAGAGGGTWSGDVDVLAESLLGLLFGASVNWLCTGDDALFRRCATDAAQTLADRLVTGSGRAGT